MLIRVLFLYLIFFLNLNAKDNLTYGLGLSFLSTPSYIGSSKQNNMILPFPYIEYKGKYFSVDKDKIYNELYDTNNINLEVSIRGMLPVDSENTSRQGMPDLDALLEVGPKITYNILKKKDVNVSMQIPLRLAFSIGEDLFKYQGYYTSLDLNYKNKLFDDFNFSFTTGFSFSDKKLNNYYYGVEDKYITNTREKYEANSGYSSFHNTFSITKKDDNFWYGCFFKHYYLKESTFENSPLVDKKNSVMYGLAFSYLF